MSSRVELSSLERIIRRDRLTMAAALAVMTLVAWMYLLTTGASMKSMTMEAQMHAAMGMADLHASSATDWLALFVMWAVMMVGMMLPSAAPVILLVLAAYRRHSGPHTRASAGALAGYLLVWTSFSAVAATAQVVLRRAALLSAEMTTRSAVVAGTILMVAGVYQWLPIKKACLTQCRSPLGFLTRYWRDGLVGAFTLGVRHGAFCLGCCWALMALLFVVGVMNLVWVAVIAGFVLVEKLAPRGVPLGRAAGILLILWGTYEVLT